jgi:hypothetical protein
MRSLSTLIFIFVSVDLPIGAGQVGQVGKHLPSKYETLSSNPGTTKKNKP